MKRKIFISLGVLGILIGVFVFLSFALTGFDFNTFIGKDERTPEYLTYQESISKINVSITSDNLILKKSEDDSIHINYFESNIYDFKIFIENDTLTILQKKPWYIMFSFTKARNIEIALPDSLAYANLKVSSGSINISSEIEIEELSAKASSGEIFLKDLTVDNAEINVSSGSITITNFETKILEVTASSGKIILKKVKAEGADISLSSGSINLEDANFKNLKISASSGKITATKLFVENSEISASSGTVNLGVVANNPDDYSLDLKTSSGKISVQKDDYNISVYGNLFLGNGPNSIKVIVSSGNITINFEKSENV